MSATGTAILVALVGMASALLGGFIQAFSARKFEQIKFARQAKWELYSNYFVALGELTFAEHGTERHQNALSFIAQIRGRIGVIGSPEVIEAVGAVFGFKDLLTPEAQAAMARALEAMRKDVGERRSKIDHRHFVQLMFGSRDHAH